MQAAAQASYYLPSYDSRQIASTISYLREQIEAAKKMHLGKKFGFSRKSKKLPAGQPATPLAEVHINHVNSNIAQQQQHLAEHTTANDSSGVSSAQQLR